MLSKEVPFESKCKYIKKIVIFSLTNLGLKYDVENLYVH